MDLVRKLLMSPMSRKKNANNSNKRLSMPVCSSQTANIPLKSRNKESSQNQSAVSISLHQSSTSLSNSGSTKDLKYFGEPLQDILSREQSKVPRLVVVASQFICDRGLQQEGLFRVSGNARAIENLKVAIGRSGEVKIGDDAEVGTVASLLKMFFRHLPDSLIPQDVTEPFLRLMSDNSYSKERIFKELKQLCQDLPANNYNTLKYLIQLLVLVARHEHDNKMSPQALGIVFGPNIFRTNMKNQGVTNYIVTCFISGYDKIFRTSEEVFSLDVGEISHPNIMRPAPSRPRRHSNAEDLPATKLKPKRDANSKEGEGNIGGGDDNDVGGGEIGEVGQSPINQSLPSSTPWSLGFDERESPSQGNNTDAKIIDEPSPFDDAIPNDESLHSLKCLEEEISMIISSNLFPVNTNCTDDDKETSDHKTTLPDDINTIPRHQLLMNYHRAHGPKNRKLPSNVVQKNFNGNTKLQTPTRKSFKRPGGVDSKPSARHSMHQQILPPNNVARVGSSFKANKRDLPEVANFARRGSSKQANHTEGVKKVVKPYKEDTWRIGGKQAGDDDDALMRDVLICVDKIEHYPPEKVTRRKVANPAIKKASRMTKITGNNNNDKSDDVTVAMNNSCVSGDGSKDDDDGGDDNDGNDNDGGDDGDGDGDEEKEDDDAKSDDGETNDKEENERSKCEEEEEEEGKDHENELKASVSQRCAGTDDNRFISSSSTSVKTQLPQEHPPKIPPKMGSNAPQASKPRPQSEESPPTGDVHPAHNNLPSLDNVSNDSVEEGVSLFMNLSQPSLCDGEEHADDVFMVKVDSDEGREGHRRSDADDNDSINYHDLSISMTKSQETNSKDHFISDDHSIPESQNSVEEQIQECVSDLQRFRENLKILEEKYIARFNQKPSKIARMIDKDMNYYETQIKKCQFMLRKLKNLRERIPSAGKPQQATKSPRRRGDDDDDSGEKLLNHDELVACDMFCCDLQKKKDDIEQLRCQLFGQQKAMSPHMSPHVSPRVHRARKMSVSSPRVGEVVQGGHRREGTKSLSPFRHLPLDPTNGKERPHPPQANHHQSLVDETSSLPPISLISHHHQDHHPQEHHHQDHHPQEHHHQDHYPQEHHHHQDHHLQEHHHHHQDHHPQEHHHQYPQEHHHQDHHPQEHHHQDHYPQEHHHQDHQDHHHHRERHHEQQYHQLINDSPRARRRQIVLEPISHEISEGLKELKRSMERMEKELEESRIVDKRNFSINLMTMEELRREKVDMQRALLKFESIYGRPTSKPAKSMVKSIYARYSEVKKELRRFEEIQFNEKSLPLPTKVTSFSDSHHVKNSDNSHNDDNGDNDGGDDGAHIKVDDDRRMVDLKEDETGDGHLSEKDSMLGLEMLLNKFALTQLVDEKSRLMDLKSGMVMDLKTFEKNFKRINGRDMQKTDRFLKQDSYSQLKELKAQLQLIDNLITKKYLEEENKNE